MPTNTKHAVGVLLEADIRPFGEEHGLDLSETFTLLNHCAEYGLLHSEHSSLDDPIAVLIGQA